MIWGVIPQVFYDFLGRIMPGAAVTTIAALVVYGPEKAADFIVASPHRTDLFAFGPLMIWLLGSYLVGFVTAQLWDMTLGRLTKTTEKALRDDAVNERLLEHERVQAALGRPVLGLHPGQRPAVFVMLDHLRL